MWQTLIPIGLELADRTGLMDAIGLGGGRDYSPQEKRNMQTQEEYNRLSMDIAKDRYGREQQYMAPATDAIFDYANRMSNKERPMLYGRGIFEPKFGQGQAQQTIQPGGPMEYTPVEELPDLEAPPPLVMPSEEAEVPFDEGRVPGSYGEWDVGPYGQTQTVADDSDLFREEWDPETGGFYRLVDQRERMKPDYVPQYGRIRPEPPEDQSDRDRLRQRWGPGDYMTDDLYARTDTESGDPNAWAYVGADTQRISQRDANILSEGGAVMGPGDMPINTPLQGFDPTGEHIWNPIDYDPMYDAYGGARAGGNWVGYYPEDPNAPINAPREIVEGATSISDPAIAEDLLQATSVDRDTQLRENGVFRELVPMGGDYFVIRITDAEGNMIDEISVGRDDTGSSTYDPQSGREVSQQPDFTPPPRGLTGLDEIFANYVDQYGRTQPEPDPIDAAEAASEWQGPVKGGRVI